MPWLEKGANNLVVGEGISLSVDKFLNCGMLARAGPGSRHEVRRAGRHVEEGWQEALLTPQLACHHRIIRNLRGSTADVNFLSFRGCSDEIVRHHRFCHWLLISALVSVGVVPQFILQHGCKACGWPIPDVLPHHAIHLHWKILFVVLWRSSAPFRALGGPLWH